jgi:hypothetical protein
MSVYLYACMYECLPVHLSACLKFLVCPLLTLRFTLDMKVSEQRTAFAANIRSRDFESGILAC